MAASDLYNGAQRIETETTVRIYFRWTRTDTGAPYNPTTKILKIRRPDGVVDEIEVDKLEATTGGEWYYDYTPTIPGRYLIYAKGEFGFSVKGEGYFDVAESEF